MHVGWLNTMATNNHCCLLESTYLSSDYTAKQINLQKEGYACMNAGQRGAPRIKNKPRWKHNNCPAQKIPLSGQSITRLSKRRGANKVKPTCLTNARQLCLPLMRPARIYKTLFSVIIKTRKWRNCHQAMRHIPPASHTSTKLAKAKCAALIP